MAAYKSKTSPATWEERYNTASSNQAKMFKRFSNWYDSLYAIVGVTPSPWRSKMYVPILARQTWALIAKFLSLKPGFEVRLQEDDFDQEELEQRAAKAQHKLDYDYNNPLLDESIRDKLFCTLLDATVTGTGLAKVCWRVTEKVTYSRLPTDDGTVDLTKEKKKTRKVGYNDLEPVNIFNVFVSPAATNLYTAPWIIIKEDKTVAELKKINKEQGGNIYTNLDKLTGSTTYDDDGGDYNWSRNRLMNQQDRLDSTLKMVKIYECYEGDTICTYAESQTDSDNTNWLLIREQQNPYWHGKYPLVKFHVKNRPFQFWGEGLFETTYRLQAGYNDAFNHFMDQWNLSENSMLMMPERANVNDYVVEPGGVITFRGDIPPQQFKHAAPDGNALQTILQLMDSAVEGVTISNYASGIPNSASDKTKGTATGILKLQEAAGDLVGFMKANYTQSITQIGRMWLSNNQQYMQSAITVMVNNKGRINPTTITPQDMQGDMDLVVNDASMEPSTPEQKQQANAVFTQQFLGLKQAADQQHQMLGTPPLAVDFTQMTDKLAQDFGYHNYEAAIIPDEQLQQMIAANDQKMQQMAASQQQPKEPKAPSESINYKDAPEDIKRQIEQQAGLQPSTGISPSGVDQMTKMQKTEQQAQQQEHKQGMDMASTILQAQQQDHTQDQAMTSTMLQAQQQEHAQAQAQAQAMQQEQQPQEAPQQNMFQRVASKLRGGNDVQ